MFFASPPWDLVTYWSLDLETGGLDPKRDAIVAIGMVPVRGATIRLGEAFRTLVRPEDGRPVAPESIRAHQLVWGELAEAPPLPEALREVQRRLNGEEVALLVHHRALDVAFLTRAFKRHGLRWPDPPVVDTVELLVKHQRRERFRRPDLPDDLPDLNLGRARERFELPHYAAHDALTDAVATAELFLVLRHALDARKLRDLR